MDVLVGWLWAVEFWHWWAFGLLLLVVEAFVASTVLVWPAAGSFVTGVVIAFEPELDWRYQILILALASGAAAFAWDYRFGGKRMPVTDRPDLNVRTDRYLGRRAVLADELADGRGRVTFDDGMWQVRNETGEPLAAGTRIEVVGADGPTLLVRRVAADRNPL